MNEKNIELFDHIQCITEKMRLDYVAIKVCLSDTASLYIKKDGSIELVTKKHRAHIGFMSSLELDHFDQAINDALVERMDELCKKAHEEIKTWALISSGVTP